MEESKKVVESATSEGEAKNTPKVDSDKYTWDQT